MNIASHLSERSKLFFALSRTQHILIDIATPAVCALLLLGNFPSLAIIIVGLITAFAGYNATVLAYGRALFSGWSKLERPHPAGAPRDSPTRVSRAQRRALGRATP